MFGKPCFCALPKRGSLDENGDNDKLAFYPLKTRASLLRPPKTTKMSLRQRHGLEKKPGLFFPEIPQTKKKQCDRGIATRVTCLAIGGYFGRVTKAIEL